MYSVCMNEEQGQIFARLWELVPEWKRSDDVRAVVAVMAERFAEVLEVRDANDPYYHGALGALCEVLRRAGLCAVADEANAIWGAV